MGRNTLTYHRLTDWGKRVFTRSVKNIVLLNERRIALAEPTIRLQSHDQLTLTIAFHIIDQTLEER